jgi:hypothetical protein
VAAALLATTQLATVEAGDGAGHADVVDVGVRSVRLDRRGCPAGAPLCARQATPWTHEPYGRSSTAFSYLA